MNHLRCSWKTFLSAGAILGCIFVLAGHAQSSAETPAQATFQRTCSGCHSITVVTSRRLSHAGWENVVDTMVSRGAQATPDEIQQIVSYLTANLGVDSPAAKNAGSGEASVPAPRQSAPVLDNSQITRAKKLIQTSGCLSCHRVDGEGSYVGPYLGDIGANDTAEQIRASMVSPSKELTPQNRSVQLITQDGTTVVGKLLNQDGFSVQLIDASGNLLSFEKANLRDFTIITANPMPSYADTMAPEDLSLIIKYLGGLTGTTQQ